LTKPYRGKILAAMKVRKTGKKGKKKRPKTQQLGPKRNKKAATRDKILEAAKKVFSEHPYSAASIRMIGNAAEIDHPLISYYFPTKADLFEALIEEISETYYHANTAWFEGLESMSLSHGLSLYIDRMLDFISKHPETLRIVALNLAQPKETEVIPGYGQMQRLLVRNTETFRRIAAPRSSTREIRMFTESFNMMVINYLGAASYYAGILGMKPGGPAYRRWVKETLQLLFLPLLRQLVRGEDHGASQKRRSSPAL
jgi:AcrR family transcriptional regulator